MAAHRKPPGLQPGLREIHATILQYLDLLGLLLIGHGIQSTQRDPHAYFRIHRTGHIPPSEGGGSRGQDRPDRTADHGRITIRILHDPFVSTPKDRHRRLVLMRLEVACQSALYRVAPASDEQALLGAVEELLTRWIGAGAVRRGKTSRLTD